jgi:hypothetical protein
MKAAYPSLANQSKRRIQRRHRVSFYKGSPVQLYCKYVNEYYIKENDTVHIIASIESLFLMKTWGTKMVGYK